MRATAAARARAHGKGAWSWVDSIVASSIDTHARRRVSNGLRIICSVSPCRFWQDLAAHFERTCDFIDRALSGDGNGDGVGVGVSDDDNDGVGVGVGDGDGVGVSVGDDDGDGARCEARRRRRRPPPRVLVHCFQGKSRSAALLCAYLIRAGPGAAPWLAAGAEAAAAAGAGAAAAAGAEGS